MTMTATALDVAKLFLCHWLRFAGIPADIISDRQTRFTGLFRRELMKLMGIQQKLSTAYHPQTDGETERTNQTLETCLRCNSSSSTWPNDLPNWHTIAKFRSLRNSLLSNYYTGRTRYYPVIRLFQLILVLLYPYLTLRRSCSSNNKTNKS
mmetsp:Transcript_5841/g.8241  ORF Transcript_5841/g.8241 Transcript_5841/m.8241 type:complete len:151 (+) Transcript_5841:226-678(+)